jgi:DNA-binding CsgD family transcriptional regulator
VDDSKAEQLRLPLAVLLVLIAVGGAVDLVLDRPANWLAFHPLYEIVLVLAGLGTATWLWRGWRAAQVENIALRTSVARHLAEREAWRLSAETSLAGLGAAITDQLTKWGLTPAERDVALRLLMGLSHKEIAARTKRSERTVRQHAAAAYEKAGLSGRAELAAFFLEGLLPPGGDTR